MSRCPSTTQEAAKFAASWVNHVADQVARGERGADQVERCIHYYARAMAVPAEEIRKAMDDPGNMSC